MGKPISEKICKICRRDCNSRFLEHNYNYYHIDCFKCSICEKTLDKDSKLYRKNGQLYCFNDYEKKFCKKCARCHDYIHETYIEGFLKYFHRKCFKCFNCDNPVNNNIVCEKSGNLLCMTCWEKDYKQKTYFYGDCCGCKLHVLAPPTKQIGKCIWHSNCFRCTVCKLPLHHSYYVYDRKAYCDKDYETLADVLDCSLCNEPIKQQFINIGDGMLLHSDCAKCTKCKVPITNKEGICRKDLEVWHLDCSYSKLPPPMETNLDDVESLDNRSLRSTEASELMSIITSKDSEKDYLNSLKWKSKTLNYRSIPCYQNINENNDWKSQTLNGRTGYSTFERNTFATSSYRTPTSGFKLRTSKSGFSDDFLRTHSFSYLKLNPPYLKGPIGPKLPNVQHFHTLERNLQGFNIEPKKNNEKLQNRNHFAFEPTTYLAKVINMTQNQTPKLKTPNKLLNNRNGDDSQNVDNFFDLAPLEIEEREGEEISVMRQPQRSFLQFIGLKEPSKDYDEVNTKLFNNVDLNVEKNQPGLKNKNKIWKVWKNLSNSFQRCKDL